MSVSVADIAARPKPEPERDRWGRYVIEGPDGRPDVYRRCTSVAHKLGDSEGLEYWKRTMTASGVGAVPELAKLAAANPDPKLARSVYKEILEAADEASGANAGRRRGQALHALTEHLDLGAPLRTDGAGTWWLETPAGANPIPVEADDAQRLIKYQQTLEREGITIVRAHVEQVLVLDALRIAGTADRFVRRADGTLTVLDLKTGSLEYGHLEWAAQLAMYANHDATWCHLGGDNWERQPAVGGLDREWGIVVHLPATGEPECTVHWLDLEAGYGGLVYASGLMEYRRLKVMAPYNGGLKPEAKAVYFPEAPTWTALGDPEVDEDGELAPVIELRVNAQEGTPENLRAWIEGRIRALGSWPKTFTTKGPEGALVELGPIQNLTRRWPSTVPLPLPDVLTEVQAIDMDRALAIVEMEHEAPFPPSRPGLTVAEVKAGMTPRAEPAKKAVAKKATVKKAATKKATTTRKTTNQKESK